MTAAYLPDGIEIPQITGPMLKKGVVIAAGLHKDIKTRYIRFGHMGVTACDTSRGDVDKVIKALTEALDEAGYKRPQA